MILRTLAVVSMLGALGACSTTSSQTAPTEAEKAAESDPAILEQGRELTRQFYDGELDALWARMSDEMKSGLQSVEALGQFREQVLSQIGTETEVLDEQTTTSPPHRVYIRTAKFSKAGSTPVIVQWAIGPDDEITGFFIRPAQ